MDELFRFLGSYWWLVFPLGGAIAASYGAIEKSLSKASKNRHKRKLELLAAKAELKSAAGGGSPRKTKPALTEPSHQQKLTAVIADHDDVNARWLEYELDVAKLIAFPLMSDGREPLTAAYLRAKRKADGLRPASEHSKVSAEELGDYRTAVDEYIVAFDIAEKEARRVRNTSFSDDERKRLDRAQQLLQIAVDQGASKAERQVAYKRVRDELDGLIVLSDDAVTKLEEKVSLELPSS